MKRLILILSTLLLAGASARAANESLSGMAPPAVAEPRTLAAEAEKAYQRENYSAAAEFFGRIARETPNDPEAHYNLGCAEYRAGRIGRAIAAWRSALRLDPNHEDARANLEFARSRRVDRIKSADAGGWERHWIALKSRAPLLFTLANFLFFGLVIAAVLRVRSPWSSAMRTAIIASGILLIFTTTLLVRHQQIATDERVVIVEVAEVFREPNATQSILTVHDGLEVAVARRESGRCEIRIGENTLGWIEERALARITP